MAQHRPGSNVSRGSQMRRSRGASRQSQVDEMLFGNTTRPTPSGDAQPDSGLSDFFSGNGTTRSAGPRRRGSKTVQLVTKDHVRTIRVPEDGGAYGASSTDDQPLILSAGEYRRIKASSVVRTKSAIERDRAAAQAERRRREDEAAQRREEMSQYTRAKEYAPTDLDLEAKARNEEVVAKALRQMEEQEDEIKRLNELIIGAKCHAIRDAQLAEKAALLAQLQEEERQLDEMMEQERVAALERQRLRDQELRAQRRVGAGRIRDQIEEREMQRVLEEELREQETQAILEQMRRNEEEDRQRALRKKEEAAKLMEVVAQSNAESIALKQQRLEQERLEDLKVAEFLKAKEAREDQAEREKEEARRTKELEAKRLLAMQERSMDTVAEKHALLAKRQQEAIERQARRKEAEEAEARRRAVEEVDRAREAQVRAKQEVRARESAADQREYERILQARREQEEAEARARSADHRRRQQFSEQIRAQIDESEAHRATKRDAYFEEGRKLDQEAAERRRRLDEIKQRKLAELQALGLDDKYLHGVIRAVNNPPKQSFAT